MKKVVFSLLTIVALIALLAGGCAPTATTKETTTETGLTPPPAASTQPPATTTQPPVTTTPAPAATIATVTHRQADGTRFKVSTTTSLFDTGLWAYLQPVFEKEENVKLDIVSAGTGAALNQARMGNVDAVAVHDPDLEKAFVEEGFGLDKRAFAYNYFMIAGPASDPAGIKGLAPVDAFKKIAEAGKLDSTKVKFISRGDNSGTYGAEKRLWVSAGYDYVTGIEKSGKWYIEAGQGMGPTLVMANEQQAYVLADMSTFLSYQGKMTLVSLVEGAAEASLNIYNVYAVSPGKIPTAKIAIAKDFINWLISPECQKLIADYRAPGTNTPLFNPISDGGCKYPACPDLSKNLIPVK